MTRVEELEKSLVGMANKWIDSLANEWSCSLSHEQWAFKDALNAYASAIREEERARLEESYRKGEY